ncbi:MAG TPA: PilZ domain-containing protein, partial [Sphingomicrobium sp.]|nr:PilZ domain-containing protein [Sphingomicrobium sp.]
EPQPWDRAKLHLDADRPIECKVLWIRDGRIGLEFAQPIKLECAESAQAAVLRQVITRHFPDARFEPAAEQPVQAEESAPEDQRISRRSPLLRMGTLHYDFKSTPARLRDISSFGATIETTAALVPGAEPLLDLGEAGSVFATVVWTRGDEAGLRFNQPFDLTQLPKARAQNEQWRELPLSDR